MRKKPEEAKTAKAYEALLDKLGQFPTAGPRTSHIYSIMEELFSEDEALLASGLPMHSEELDHIAAGMGIEPAALGRKLEALADRGLVFAGTKNGKKVYRLFPFLPGIAELQFMKAEVTPRNKKLAKLFDEYYNSGWGKAAFTASTPFSRVITIEQEVPGGGAIMPYDRVSHLIDSTTSLGLAHCYCRHEADLLGKSCGKQKETCMVLGPFAEYAIERGFARRVGKDEMKELLKKCEDEGLVHITDNIQSKVNFICNCCGCCCGILGTITKLNIPSAIATSGFVARSETSECTGCEICVEVCEVNAVELREKSAFVLTERCIGCALCVSHCPSGAMRLENSPAGKPEPSASLKEIGMKILMSKAGN